MIDTLVDAARSPEFLAGLAPGAAALLLGVFLGAAAWAGGRRVVVPAGILAACAALVGLRQIMTVPPGLVVGLGLLAAAGGTARALGLSPAVAVGALVPGALVVAYRAELEPIAWMQALVVGGVVGGAALTGAFDQRWRQSGAPPVMLAVTAVGVWATVPEVSHALVLVGAMLPLAALGRPFPLAGLGAG
ncbi:MAG: hypothetical protein ACRD0D_01100, partial [Acidimicrobiales bacterium]